MKLFTKDIRNKLAANGQKQAQAQEHNEEINFKPVVKLFTPDSNATWLLTEVDPYDPDIAFGLCDLGMGFPELGSVRLSELESLLGVLGLPIERDLHFSPAKTLSQYAEEASQAGRIIT